MSNDFVTMTRTLVKREWSDIEPKIAIGIATGSIATGLVTFLQPIAKAYGLDVPESVWVGIPAFISMLGGYLTPSVGANITQPLNDKVISETHSGPVTTTVTGPVPIQGRSNWVADAVKDYSSNSGIVVAGTDPNATVAYNPN